MTSMSPRAALRFPIVADRFGVIAQGRIENGAAEHVMLQNMHVIQLTRGDDYFIMRGCHAVSGCQRAPTFPARALSSRINCWRLGIASEFTPRGRLFGRERAGGRPASFRPDGATTT